MKRLADRAYDRYSQSGEDGVVEGIFEHIGTTSKTCIELGAWDGFHLSNTANLWTQGWAALLIEAETERYQQLLDNTGDQNCVCVEAWVGTSGPNTLDAIVARTGFPMEPDFLSIDIDGDDYHLFASLEDLRPRLISCEFNPTIPPPRRTTACTTNQAPETFPRTWRTHPLSGSRPVGRLLQDAGLFCQQ